MMDDTVDHAVDHAVGDAFDHAVGDEPQVYAELTSREVMTMEWVEGARLSDRKMLDTYGLEPSRLVDTMVGLDWVHVLAIPFILPVSFA